MQKTLVKRKARVSKIVGKGRKKSTNDAEVENGGGEEIPTHQQQQQQQCVLEGGGKGKEGNARRGLYAGNRKEGEGGKEERRGNSEGMNCYEDAPTALRQRGIPGLLRSPPNQKTTKVELYTGKKRKKGELCF